jgi:hypothetical protein
MWDEVATRLPEYASAVLTWRDAEGYPYSIRCVPRAEAGSQSFLIVAPPGAPLQVGPASLLCHKHDEWLWHQRSFLARGTLERAGAGEDAGWRFRLRSFVPGMGEGGAPAMLRFIVGARRAAGRYLAHRGLPCPVVPWGSLNVIKREALLNVAQRRALAAPVVESAVPAPQPTGETRAVRPWVGLAVGLAIVGGLLALGMWWARRRRRPR